MGVALGNVAKTIHIALAPVSALVWGYDRIKDFVSSRVAEKLKDTPQEQIQPPKANIAGPALEALRYTGHEPTLRELYANLLAASMDKRTAAMAHPSFVEIVKQLLPDEARLLAVCAEDRAFPLITVRVNQKPPAEGGRDVLRHFSLLGVDAKCEIPNLVPSYLDNLTRLGIIEIPQFFRYMAPNVYDALENHPEVLAVVELINKQPDKVASIDRKGFFVTQLGRQFIAACVVDHSTLKFST